MEINHGGGAARGLVLLIGGAPGGKRRQPVRPEAALGLLATLPSEALLGSAIPASVLQLADPADPQLLLAHLQTASRMPGPVLVALAGQLTADRRRKELHLALAHTSRDNARYTALPWAWLGDQLRQRPGGTTTVLADLVADPEAWSVLQQHGPEALTAGLPLFGQVSPPGTTGDGYAPPYTRALVDQLRRAPVGTRPADLHHLASHSGLPAGALLLTSELPTAVPRFEPPATPPPSPVPTPTAALRPASPTTAQFPAPADPDASTPPPSAPGPGLASAPAPAPVPAPPGPVAAPAPALGPAPAPASGLAPVHGPAPAPAGPPTVTAPSAALPPGVPEPDRIPVWPGSAAPAPVRSAVVPTVVVPPTDPGTVALDPATRDPHTMSVPALPIPAPAVPVPVPAPGRTGAPTAGEQHDRAGTAAPTPRETTDPRPGIAAALHNGDLARGAYLIADWERQLLRHQGPRAPQLADVAEAQAQLALAGGELGRATERLIEAARLRTQSLPPQAPELAMAVDNAVAIWGRLPRETALQHGAALLTLCRTLPPGGSRLRDVEARLAQLSGRGGLLRRAR